MGVAVGLFTAALINRSLGPSLRGVYAEMQTWVGLFAVLFGLSMDTAIYHIANRSIYGEDDQSRFVTIFSLSLGYAFLSAAALAIFVFLWPQRVSPETINYLLFLDALLILTMLVGNLIVFLQALGHIRYSAIIGVAQGMSNAAIIGYAYVAWSIDLFVVLCSVLLVQAVGLTMLLIQFSKFNFFRGNFSGFFARTMITAGFKQHIATVSTFVYTKINQLILFGYWGGTETGIFAVALSAAFYLMFIPMTFQTVLYPRVIHATDDFEVTIRSLRLCFYGWGGIVLLMVLLAEPILLVYGGKSFLQAVTPFRILMIAAWFLPLASLTAPYCIKVGAFYVMTTTALILGVISVGLNLLFIPKFSATGAAVATSSTCVLGFFLSLLLLGYLRKQSPLEFLRLRIFR